MSVSEGNTAISDNHVSHVYPEENLSHPLPTGHSDKVEERFPAPLVTKVQGDS